MGGAGKCICTEIKDEARSFDRYRQQHISYSTEVQTMLSTLVT